MNTTPHIDRARTTHSVNVIKSAIVDGRTVTAASVTLQCSIHKALAQLGAREPRFRGRHGGISIFNCADGWTYLVNVNPKTT